MLGPEQAAALNGFFQPVADLLCRKAQPLCLEIRFAQRAEWTLRVIDPPDRIKCHLQLVGILDLFQQSKERIRNLCEGFRVAEAFEAIH